MATASQTHSAIKSTGHSPVPTLSDRISIIQSNSSTMFAEMFEQQLKEKKKQLKKEMKARRELEEQLKILISRNERYKQMITDSTTKAQITDTRLKQLTTENTSLANKVQQSMREVQSLHNEMKAIKHERDDCITILSKIEKEWTGKLNLQKLKHKKELEAIRENVAQIQQNETKEEETKDLHIVDEMKEKMLSLQKEKSKLEKQVEALANMLARKEQSLMEALSAANQFVESNDLQEEKKRVGDASTIIERGKRNKNKKGQAPETSKSQSVSFSNSVLLHEDVDQPSAPGLSLKSIFQNKFKRFKDLKNKNQKKSRKGSFGNKLKGNDREISVSFSAQSNGPFGNTRVSKSENWKIRRSMSARHISEDDDENMFVDEDLKEEDTNISPRDCHSDLHSVDMRVNKRIRFTSLSLSRRASSKDQKKKESERFRKLSEMDFIDVRSIHIHEINESVPHLSSELFGDVTDSNYTKEPERPVYSEWNPSNNTNYYNHNPDTSVPFLPNLSPRMPGLNNLTVDSLANFKHVINNNSS